MNLKTQCEQVVSALLGHIPKNIALTEARAAHLGPFLNIDANHNEKEITSVCHSEKSDKQKQVRSFRSPWAVKKTNLIHITTNFDCMTQGEWTISRISILHSWIRVVSPCRSDARELVALMSTSC